MDYLLNPLICTAFCAKAAMNIVPGLPFYAWLLVFAVFFTWVNLHGIKTSARLNEILCVGMVLVVITFLRRGGESARSGAFSTIPAFTASVLRSGRTFTSKASSPAPRSPF